MANNIENEADRLKSQYRAYRSIVENRGIGIELLSDEDLDQFPLPKIRQYTRDVRGIARTPMS